MKTDKVASSQRDALELGADLAAMRLGFDTRARALSALHRLAGAFMSALVQSTGKKRVRLLQSSAEGFEQALHLSDAQSELSLAQVKSTTRDLIDYPNRGQVWRVIVPLRGGAAADLAFVLYLDRGHDLIARIDTIAMIEDIWARADTFERATIARAPLDTGPLTPGNPLGLTRADYRICSLLVDGQRPAQIATHLGVSISTVRSHLQNLYAKTDSDGIVGLLHKLQAPVAARDASDAA